MKQTASPSPDRNIAFAIAAAYLATAAAHFPVAEWPRAVWAAAASFTAIYVVGSGWRGERVVALATLAVAFALMALLVMPTSVPWAGGTGGFW